MTYSIVFMGSNDFALAVLSPLYDWLQKNNLATISAVYSQPPAKKNRGMKLTHNSVSAWAEKNNIPTRHPTSLNSDEKNFLQSLKPNLLLVVAYGMILPADILNIAPAINIHPSLLPKHRGPTPIENTLLAGDDKTGVCLMLLNDQHQPIDSGDIIAHQEIMIDDDDNRLTLQKKCSDISFALLQKNLANILVGKIAPAPQNHQQASHSKKIRPTDYRLDSEQMDSLTMIRKIRSYYPKSYIMLPDNARLQILSAKTSPHISDKLLTQENNKILLKTKDATIELDMVKPAGKKEMTAGDWWRGRKQ